MIHMEAIFSRGDHMAHYFLLSTRLVRNPAIKRLFNEMNFSATQRLLIGKLFIYSISVYSASIIRIILAIVCLLEHKLEFILPRNANHPPTSRCVQCLSACLNANLAILIDFLANSLESLIVIPVNHLSCNLPTLHIPSTCHFSGILSTYFPAFKCRMQ